MPGVRLAKRKVREEELVKCRVLPDDIGVQHGVLCSEVWWGLRPCFGRGWRVFEEDGLGPFPPAVCGRRGGRALWFYLW